MRKLIPREMKWLLSPCFRGNTRRRQRADELFSGTLLHFIELISGRSAATRQNLRTCLFFPWPLQAKRFSSLLKRPVCAWTKKKKEKGRKISTSLNLRRNKNKQTQEKGAAQEVHGFSEPQILLMWLKAACQPNLIWIYIQRKCLV